MKWTQKKPTREGYYWRRVMAGDIEADYICEIRRINGSLCVDEWERRLFKYNTGLRRLFKYNTGLWAGPIPRPR